MPVRAVGQLQSRVAYYEATPEELQRLERLNVLIREKHIPIAPRPTADIENPAHSVLHNLTLLAQWFSETVACGFDANPLDSLESRRIR